MAKYKIEDYELSSRHFPCWKGCSFRLDTKGDTLQELVDNARITILDDYYFEMFSDDLCDFSDEIVEYVENIIKKEIANA